MTDRHASILTASEIRELVRYEHPLCLTIFMPTETAGAEIQQNPLRLKNLIDEARELLAERRLPSGEIQAMLAPLEDLLTDLLFWQHQSTCFAAFLSPEGAQTFRLPVQCESSVILGPRYHILPLFSLLQGDGLFYMLALELNQVRLFQATRYSVTEVDLGDTPASLEDFLGPEEFQRHVQWHSGAPGRSGRRDALYHGVGPGDDIHEKKDIMRFFHALDKGLARFFQEESHPLVLIGVEYLHPMYKEANTYPNLLDRGVSGSPKMKEGKDLFAEAWELVRPQFDRERREDLKSYANLSATDQTSTDLHRILAGAHYGRLAALFVTRGTRQWGRYNPETNELILHEERKPDSEELVNLAAARAFQMGGRVYLVDTGESPGGAPLAATFRYPEPAL